MVSYHLPCGHEIRACEASSLHRNFGEKVKSYYMAMRAATVHGFVKWIPSSLGRRIEFGSWPDNLELVMLRRRPPALIGQ